MKKQQNLGNMSEISDAIRKLGQERRDRKIPKTPVGTEKVIHRDGRMAIKLRWYAKGPSLIIGWPADDIGCAIPINTIKKANKIIAAMQLIVQEIYQK